MTDFFLSHPLQPALVATSVQHSPFSFEELLSQSRKKLFIIGQALRFLAQDKVKKKLFAILKQKQISVDIMISDNKQDYILKYLSAFTGQAFTTALHRSINKFLEWQKEADKENLKLTVKLSKKIGTLSLTFVDPGRKDAKLLLIPIFAGSYTLGRPCFWITKKEHGQNFNAYFQVYETLWRTGARRICRKARRS